MGGERASSTIPVYGRLGYLQLTADMDDGDDGFLYRVAQERHREMDSEIRRRIGITLGSDFEALTIRIDKGSVHVLVALGAAITFFMKFSRYESFVKSVNLLVSQIRNILRRFFESASPGAPGIEVNVTGTWQPSSTMLQAHDRLSATSGLDSGSFLLWYLVLTNSALLAILIWLVVRHLT